MKLKLQREQGEQAASPEALVILDRLDLLIGSLSEANREQLAFAVRQTVKRITLAVGTSRGREAPGDPLARSHRVTG